MKSRSELANDARGKLDIVYTGLRPGEKLHETLFGFGEVDDRPVHPLISHVRVPPLDTGESVRFDVPTSPTALNTRMHEACGMAFSNGSERIRVLSAGHPPGRVTTFEES